MAATRVAVLARWLSVAELGEWGGCVPRRVAAHRGQGAGQTRLSLVGQLVEQQRHLPTRCPHNGRRPPALPLRFRSGLVGVCLPRLHLLPLGEVVRIRRVDVPPPLLKADVEPPQQPRETAGTVQAPAVQVSQDIRQAPAQAVKAELTRLPSDQVQQRAARGVGLPRGKKRACARVPIG